MLPRATTTRTQREATAGKVGGRTQEIQRLIGRSLRSVTRLPELGERTIWVDCDVIQADGGTRTASITGGFVAMVLALQRLRAKRRPAKPFPSRITWPPRASASSTASRCSTWLTRRTRSAEVDMNIVKTGDGRFIEVQGTAEGPPFERRRTRRSAGARRSGHPRARRDAAHRSSVHCCDEAVEKLLVATTNPGKMREIAAFSSGAPVEIVTLDSLPPVEEPEETGDRHSPRTPG